MLDMHPIAAARLAADRKNDPEPKVLILTGLGRIRCRDCDAKAESAKISHTPDCPWSLRCAHYEQAAWELSDLLHDAEEAAWAAQCYERVLLSEGPDSGFTAQAWDRMTGAVKDALALLRPSPAPGGKEGE